MRYRQRLDGKDIDSSLEGNSMDKKRIPVVWGVDKNYILQAFVVMRSILLHSSENYHFFVLTADCIEEEVKEFTGILRKEYDNFKISTKVIDSVCLEGARIFNSHLSEASYFRLFIPEIIQEYDKCIYLDCDLIVHGDLKQLYEINLGNHYLAGVKDCHIIEDTPHEREHQRILGLPTLERYINAGVLVMGLKKMRQDEIELSFMEQLKKENWYEDQDILNVCCYPFIKVLPLKYNLFHFYLGANIKCLYGLPYDDQDFEFDHDSPYILHIGGRHKAWNDFQIKGSSEWWRIAEVFSSRKSYQFYLHRCQESVLQNRLTDIIEKAEKSKRIVIWGYSENGKRLLNILSEYQLDNVIAFVDNNKAVWGETYQEIPVIGFNSVERVNEDILWIVSCQISYMEVIGQLINNGVNEKNIIHYKELFVDSQYLLSLHESAYDSLLSEMAVREYVYKLPDRNQREQYIRNIINNPLQYNEEYAYLAEKYGFRYWLEIWQ
ncbi:MAG: glycosyltransferase family 8 protein [Lachnospiraceae bacterium]|nr:glycosyltransferase family 8 protein [Lachnospiraceae bacterium]